MKYLVTLGASAGGLAALENFFKLVPKEPDCAFVVIQHLSPDYKSLMSELLAVHTKLKIQKVEQGTEIEKNNIYLIPAGHLMSLDQEGRFALRPRNSSEMPINVFMNSAAEHYRNRMVAIVLSGTGSDGTNGCMSVSQAGGLVIAQDPSSAEFDSMPKSLINYGINHITATPEQMWSVISKYNGDSSQLVAQIADSGEGQSSHLGVPDLGYLELFSFLKNVYQIDFSSYKISSVSRRVERRMKQLDFGSVKSYLEFLRQDRRESDSLYKDLLIGVTEFFRDSEAYAILAEEVLRKSMSDPENSEEFRVWVAGCASGEEAYSIAILADEIAREIRYDGKISVFATDLHKGALEKAGSGVYSKNEVANLCEKRLKTYFKVTADGSYMIKPEIRKRIVFAHHNLLLDPPFTRIHLVTCRNLLIYLNQDSQESALGSLCYALKVGAHMFMGSSESLGKLETSFSAVSNKEKIFRKESIPGSLGSPTQLLSKPPRLGLNVPKGYSDRETMPIDKGLLASYDTILSKFIPTGLLINKDREVLHYFGDASDFIVPSRGRVDRDVLSMMHGDLKLAVSTTIQRAIATGNEAVSKSIKCNIREAEVFLDISVLPVHQINEEPKILFLKLSKIETFDAKEGDKDSLVESVGSDDYSSGRILMLEDELKSTKENLQATVEQLQVSNEELQAINEEVQVSNEELQSTNEELHSMNEELYTVNSELEQKNQQLIELNNDHESLLANTEDGVLYLDKNKRIRKFNPAISFAFNLIPQDVGRPIEDISYNLDHREEMFDEIDEVLASGARKEIEGKTSHNIYFMRRITPFHGPGDEIAGVVITFTDITDNSRTKHMLSTAMQTSSLAWWDWDIVKDKLTILTAGKCILGYECESFDQDSKYWLDRVPEEERERVKQSLDACLSGKTDRWECEHRYLNAHGQYEWVNEVGIVMGRDNKGLPLKMSGTTMNIHKQKLVELDLVESKSKLEEALAVKSKFLSAMSHEIRTPLNGICGMAELLEMDTTDSDLLNYTGIIRASADKLINYVDAIFDYSTLEIGGLNRDPSAQKLSILIEGIIDHFEPLSDEKELKIEFENHLDTQVFEVDEGYFRRVLYSFLDNAIKFTPKGGRINVTASNHAEDVYICVEDNGDGISPEFKSMIFDPFSMEDISVTRKYSGVGLGLSIAYQAAKLMDGEIIVQSEKGKGSKFIFKFKSTELTLVAPARELSTAQKDVSSLGINAMVFDDNLHNIRVLELVLQRLGCRVYCAREIGDAIELLKEHPMDIIFLDLHMPNRSGFEVLMEIRKFEEDMHLPRVPAVAYTADGSKETKLRVQEHQMDGLILKPITSKSVLNAILKACPMP